MVIGLKRPTDRPGLILRYIEIYKEDFDCRFLQKKCLLVLIYGYVFTVYVCARPKFLNYLSSIFKRSDFRFSIFTI
jgi:hypothetical protein